jgi:hypothetical protein
MKDPKEKVIAGGLFMFLHVILCLEVYAILFFCGI